MIKVFVNISLLFVFIFSLFYGKNLQNTQIQANNKAFEKKGFIIISANKDYNSALKIVKKANSLLHFDIDLRGLEYDKNIGLTISKEDCEEYGMEYPAYVQRGRGDDGNFISIESTNQYDNFTPGYFIVVVASYSKSNKKLKETLKYVKQYFKTAYIKYSKIYMGCIH